MPQTAMPVLAAESQESSVDNPVVMEASTGLNTAGDGTEDGDEKTDVISDPDPDAENEEGGTGSGSGGGDQPSGDQPGGSGQPGDNNQPGGGNGDDSTTGDNGGNGDGSDKGSTTGENGDNGDGSDKGSTTGENGDNGSTTGDNGGQNDGSTGGDNGGTEDGQTGNEGTSSQPAPAKETKDAEQEKTGSSTIDAMEEVKDISLSVYQIEKKSDGTNEYKTLQNAKISFLDNTVDYDEGKNSGTINANENNILFKVTTNTGYQLTKLQYARAEKAEDLTAAPTLRDINGMDATDANKQYSVPVDIKQIVRDKQQVAIYVTTAQVKYTVSTTNSATSTPAVYVKGANGYDWNTTANPVEVVYGGKVTFAVATHNALKVTALRNSDNAANTVTLTGTKVAANASVTPNVPDHTEFTLDASAIANLNPTYTDTIDLTIADVDGAPAVTLKGDRYSHDHITVGEYYPDSADAATKVALPATLASGNTQAYDNTKKIYFQAEADEDYEIASMEAYWRPSGAATTTPKKMLDIATGSETQNGFTNTYYMIDLTTVTEAADLYVELKAELQDASDKNSVKTVSFAASEGSHVKVVKVADAGSISDAAKSLLGKSDKTNGENYVYAVKPDEGYQISKIEVSVDKKYTDGTTPNATEKFEIGANGEKLASGTKLDPISYQKTDMTLLFEGTDAPAEGELVGKAWTTNKVSVTITTELVASQTAKTVTFVSWGNYETGTARPTGAYKISVTEDEAGKVKFNKETNQCQIAADTEYVEFSVDADVTEPVISADGGAVAERVAGEGFTYRIPAAALKDRGNIYVKRKAIDVTVNYKATGDITPTIEDMTLSSTPVAAPAFGVQGTNAASTPEGAAGYGFKMSLTNKVNADAKIKLTVDLADAAKKEAKKITSVKCQVGKGAEQDFVYNAESKKFEIEVKATDNVVVKVDTSSDRKLVVKTASGELKAENGLYELEKYNEKVTVIVYDNTGADQAIYSTSIKEGAKNAKTKATIKTDTTNRAEITVDPSEYGSDLDVEIVLADKARTTETFTLRTIKPVSAVKYGEQVKDGAISLPVDTVRYVSIEAEGVENLAAGFAANKDAKTAVASSSKVAATVRNGELVITANPAASSAGRGEAKAAYIALYNKNDATKAVIEGSMIEVNTTDATIVEKKPVVTIPSTTSRDVRVNIAAPEGTEMANVGKMIYKIEIANKTNATGDVKKAIDEALTAYNADNYRQYWGGDLTEEIRVIKDIVQNAKGEDVFIEGRALEGFEIKVTMLQSRNDNTDIVINETTGAITSVTEANCIKSAVETVNAATLAPYYENTGNGKLKLKKLNNTVVTGNMEPQAVAEPVFANGASYKNVNVCMVNMSTGKEFDGWNGMKAYYDVKTGQVMVYFTDHNNRFISNANGNNKNVGIKVTVLNDINIHGENYGSSGTLKLNVVNGLESLTVSAQPNVYKPAGKKTTFKLTEDLNTALTVDKKYAPKDKTLSYEFVKVGTSDAQVKSGTYELAPAAWALSAKNGTVTVDKDYTISKKEAENQFQILVRAAKYQGNDAYALSNTITLTGAVDSIKGRVVIMKKGTAGWSNATLCNDSKIPVINKTNADKTNVEYRLVVLKKGTPLDRPAYDLSLAYNNAGCLIEDPANYTFAPAKGNISVDANGNIIATKLGKANLVVTDKNDKKNNEKLSKEFISGGTMPVLKMHQVDDSLFMEYGKTRGKIHYSESFTFEGNNTTYFVLDVVDAKTNDMLMLSDAKVTVGKGAKNITPKKAEDWAKYGTGVVDSHQYLIAVTGKTAQITFQRKGGAKETYTLTNAAFAELKAPKAALVDKSRKYVPGTSYPNIKVKLTNGSENLEGKYVMLSMDNTKKNINARFGSPSVDQAIPVGEDNVFSFDLTTAAQQTGNYNFNVAVGVMKDGVFTQQYADAKLAVKVVKAASAKLNVTGKYKIDPKVASVLKIQYNEKDALASFVGNADSMNAVTGKYATDWNFALNAVVNGKPNRFNEFFEAKQDENGHIATIGLKRDLDANKLADIMGDSGKDDRVGWIRVTNTANNTKDVQITITFTEIKSLKAVATPVVSGKNVSTVIKLYNGKDYVAVEDYELTKPEGFVRSENKAERLKVSEDGTESDILLTSGGLLLSDGRKNLELMVVPKNTMDSNKTNLAGKFLVKATVDVGKADKGSKIKFVAKNATTWEVLHSEFVNPDSKVHEEGSWQKKIDYSFERNLSVPNGTKIVVTAANTPWITFTSDDYNVDNKTQTLTAAIDKKALAAAIAADKKKVDYGKSVKVKASFTYVNETTPVDVKGTDVTFTVKLFKKVGGAESVTAAFTPEAEAEIQNLIETNYKEAVARVTSTPAAAKNAAAEAESNQIKAKVEARARKLTEGATVTVTVTTNYTTSANVATTYTLTIMNGTKKDYEKAFSVPSAGINLANIITGIKTWSSYTHTGEADNNVGTATWTASKEDNDVKAFVSLSKDTTEEDYAKMVRSILTKKNLIDNRFSIRVEKDEKKSKAPVVGTDGKIVVTVIVTDRTARPVDNGVENHKRITLETTLPKLAGSSDAVTALQNGLKDTTVPTGGMSNLDTIMSEAWKAAAAAGATSEDDSKYNEEIEKQIVAMAKSILAKDMSGKAANDKITVKGVTAKTLTKTIADSTGTKKVTALSYELVITDATGAETKDIPVDVSFSENCDITAMQTVVGLKTAVNTAMSNMKIKAASEEAAYEAVKAEILKLSKNPAYDGKTLVKVSKHETTPRYVAATSKTNGFVNVTVDYANGKTADKLSYTNIVIIAGDDIKGATPDEKAKNKAIDLIKAGVTKDEIEKQLLEMWKRWAEKKAANQLPTATDEIKKENLITLVEGMINSADGLLKDTGYVPLSTNAVTVPTGDLTVPENSKNGTTLPAITIKIKKSGQVADTPAETIEIAGGTILKNRPEFQSLDEAEKAIKTATGATLTRPGTLTVNFLNLTTTGSGETTNLDSDSNIALAGATEAQLKKLVTNPAFKFETASTAGAAKFKTGAAAGNYQMVVDEWKVKLTNMDATDNTADAAKKAISLTVNEKKAADTVAISSIAFTVADPATGGGSESGASNAPITRKVTAEKHAIEITATPTFVNALGTAPTVNYDWSVEMTAVGGVNTAGDAEGITVDETSGNKTYLNVAETATAGADHQVTLKITAKTDQTDAKGVAYENSVYVTLTLIPEVSSITIEGPNTIELNADGSSTNASRFTAKLAGTFVHENDAKTKVVWSTTEGLTKTGSAPAGVNKTATSDTSYVDISYTSSMPADAALTADHKKITASVTTSATFTAVSGRDKATLTGITYTRNGSLTANTKIVLGEAKGVTADDTTQRGDGAGANQVKKYIVTGDEVRIPLSIDASGNIPERDWTFTLAASGDDTVVPTSNYDATLNYSGNDGKIYIKQSGKQSWLVIPADAAAIEDERAADTTVTPNVAQRKPQTIKITAATTAAAGEAVVTATPNIFALVINKSVTGMSLDRFEDGEAATIAKVTGDDSTKPIELAVNAGAAQDVYLRPAVTGFHLSADEKDGKANVTYRMTKVGNAALAGASIDGKNAEDLVAADNKAAKVTIPANAAGTLTITATYKDPESGKTTSAKRVIVVEAPDGTINAKNKVDSSAISGSVAIDGLTNSYTAVFDVDGVTSGVTWSAVATGALNGKITKTPAANAAYEVALNTNPADGLVGGTYDLTVTAQWIDSATDTMKSAQKTVTFNIERTVTGISVTKKTATDDLSSFEVGSASSNKYSWTVANTVATGEITVEVAHVGTRLLDADKAVSITLPSAEDMAAAGLTITKSGNIITIKRTDAQSAPADADKNVIITLTKPSASGTLKVTAVDQTIEITAKKAD